MRKLHTISLLVLSLGVFLGLAVPLRAQTGGLEGDVKDLDGKPMAGVTISIDRIDIKIEAPAPRDVELTSDAAGEPSRSRSEKCAGRSSVCGPASAITSSRRPTAAIRPSRTATAAVMVSRASTVTTSPPKKIRSAGALLIRGLCHATNRVWPDFRHC